MEQRAQWTAGAGRAQRVDSRIELDHLPVLRVESGCRTAGIMLGLVGGIMVLSATGFLFGETTFWGLLTPFFWVGLAILLGGVHLAIMRREIELDAERVSMRTRGIVGRKAWTEPLSAYRGVMLRSKWVHGGRNQHSYQVFLVELVHPDHQKAVEVFQSRRDEGWHATWRAMSVRFRLPALEETPDGIVTRAPEDLEKSVREMVREGSMAIAFDPSAPPPAGLSVRAADGGLDILVLRRNWKSPVLWGGVGGIVATMALLFVMAAWDVPAAVLGGIGMVGLVAAVSVAGGFLMSRARMRVGREAVTTSFMTPMGEARKQRIDPSRILDVQIHTPKGQQSGLNLHILTEDGRVYFGAGLARPDLEWLRNCLLAAIARL